MELSSHAERHPLPYRSGQEHAAVLSPRHPARSVWKSLPHVQVGTDRTSRPKPHDSPPDRRASPGGLSQAAASQTAERVCRVELASPSSIAATCYIEVFLEKMKNKYILVILATTHNGIYADQ